MRRAGKRMVAEHSLDRSHQGRAKSLRVDIWCQLGSRGQFFQNSINILMNSIKPGTKTTMCPSPRMRRPSSKNRVRIA
jgi:hypothetical protein